MRPCFTRSLRRLFAVQDRRPHTPVVKIAIQARRGLLSIAHLGVGFEKPVRQILLSRLTVSVMDG
jgi:hypothetical protein